MGVAAAHLFAFGKLYHENNGLCCLLQALMYAMFREKSCDCLGKISYFASQVAMARLTLVGQGI